MLERNHWSKIAGYISGDKPQERFGHSAVVKRNQMYVFGGWNGIETLNDVQVFNLDTHTWLTIQDVKGVIKGRYRHTAAGNETSMFIFGGIDQ